MAISSPDAVETYLMRKIDIDRDAEKLAQMWTASDDQWPGTWSKGVPMTAQRVREWYEREDDLETLVWDTGDSIAGFCSLWKIPGEENATYIATLNVAPQFQKQSLARKFLTHSIERVIALGSARLDLNTWPANLKAMPLYKKCGFFWVPGSGVRMQNYLPTILTMPCAQSFFQQHDWYRSFKRELAQAEDDERWEGMKVFTYRFAEGSDSLTVWCDQTARTVTAVETDAFFAAAIASEIEPPRGMPTTLRWKLANKRDQPLEVSLIASGTQDLKLNYRTTLRILPGESVALETPVEVAAHMPTVKPANAAPAIATLLVIDGQVVELATGMRPRAAVEVSTHPQYITLMPGVPQTVDIQMQSRLTRNIAATVSIAPQRGLTSDWTQRSVALAAEGYSALSVRLEASEGGVFALPVSLDFELDGGMVHLPGSQQAVFALPLGGVLGAQVGDMLRIENETLRLVLEQRAGELIIYDRVHGTWLAEQVGHPAPPAWPSEYLSNNFDLSIECSAQHVLAVASFASQEHPGFFVRKRISVGASPVFKIDYEFENLGAEQRRFQLRQAMGSNRSRMMLTLPLVAGLCRGSWEEFPGPADNEFKQASAYAEQWAALEQPLATIGVVWADDLEEIDWTWGMNSMTRHYDCPPRSRVCLAPLYIYVGSGDWRTVQQLWQRLTGQTVDAHGTIPTPRAPLAARLDPPLVVAADKTASATLLVEHLLSRMARGSVSLVLPEGWQADVTQVDLPSISWQQPQRADLRLTTTARPGATAGRIALRSPDQDTDFDLPLIRLGDGRAVQVHSTERAGQVVLTIANGRLELEVTPAFGGTMSALREHGVKHLASAFPRVGALGWISPWHGGQAPVLVPVGDDNFPGRLWQEIFTAEPLACEDGHGIAWRGVRQRATPAYEKLRGLTVEFDTLTVGGSPVVKQVLRVINTTPVVRRLDDAGWMVFVQPDGSRANTTLWGDQYQIKPSERMAWVRTDHWAAAQNPETGRALVLVSPLPQVLAMSFGRDGGHLGLLTRLEVPAGGRIELVAYLALAADMQEARQFAALKDLA